MTQGSAEIKRRLLTPRAAEIGRKLRRERWYQELSSAPVIGVRRFAATLLVGAILDELDAEERRGLDDVSRSPDC